VTASLVHFLDFDGVLHPYGEPELYERFRLLNNPRLFMWARILAFLLSPYDVAIIVISNWRFLFDNEALKGLMGRPGERFVGMTPSNIGVGRNRVDEIVVHAQSMKIKDWIALDEDGSLREASYEHSRLDDRGSRFTAYLPIKGRNDATDTLTTGRIIRSGERASFVTAFQEERSSHEATSKKARPTAR
jgi:HAD domain in Swiss Army Knife RNA repair proteins